LFGWTAGWLCSCRWPAADLSTLNRAAAAAVLQVSWDLYDACKLGFAALEQQVQQKLPIIELRASCSESAPPFYRLGWAGTTIESWCLPNSGELPHWQQLVSDPLSCKVAEIKEAAARTLNLSTKGGKSEIVLRVLGVFGLTGPCNAPFSTLRAAVMERGLYGLWNNSGEVSSVITCFEKLGPVGDAWMPALSSCKRAEVEASRGYGLAGWQRLLFRAGVQSRAQLLQLKAEAEQRLAEVQEGKV
jgi:hypothetical protein